MIGLDYLRVKWVYLQKIYHNYAHTLLWGALYIKYPWAYFEKLQYIISRNTRTQQEATCIKHYDNFFHLRIDHMEGSYHLLLKNDLKISKLLLHCITGETPHIGQMVRYPRKIVRWNTPLFVQSYTDGVAHSYNLYLYMIGLLFMLPCTWCLLAYIEAASSINVQHD